MFLYCACCNCISIVFCRRLIMHKARVVLLCVADYIFETQEVFHNLWSHSETRQFLQYYSWVCSALLHQSSCFLKSLFVILLTCTLVWSIHHLFLSVIHHAGWHATLIRDVRMLLNTCGVIMLAVSRNQFRGNLQPRWVWLINDYMGLSLSSICDYYMTGCMILCFDWLSKQARCMETACLLGISCILSFGLVINQCAKKVVSDSPGLVDFAIGLVNSVLNLPDGQEKIFWRSKITEVL